MVAVLSYLHLDSRTPFPAIVFNVQKLFLSISKLILDGYMYVLRAGRADSRNDPLQGHGIFDGFLQFPRLDLLRSSNDNDTDPA